MQQQPLTRTLTTEEFFRSLESPHEDSRKLTARDLLFTAAQVGGTLAACGAIHLFV